MQNESDQYWFNTHTGQVEVGKQSLALYRLGPFSSREEAERAPQIIADRAAAWRAEEEIEKD
jgi:cell division septation protein DedD